MSNRAKELISNISNGKERPYTPSSLASIETVESYNDTLEDSREITNEEYVRACETLANATAENPISPNEALNATTWVEFYNPGSSANYNTHIRRGENTFNRESIASTRMITDCSNLSTEEIFILAALGSKEQIERISGNMIKTLNGSRVTRVNPEKVTIEEFFRFVTTTP